MQQLINIHQLLLDIENPRLPIVQESQQEAIISMLKSQGERLVVLAQHIVENGLNPSNLPIVVPSEYDDEQNYHYVLDGNRRLVALKILESPSLAEEILSTSTIAKLKRLASTFESNPIVNINCVVLTSREEADTWIELTHQGQNKGAGLVEWDGLAISRYAERKGIVSKELQILNYVFDYGELSEIARQRILDNKFPITTLRRIINPPYIRGKLGILVKNGKVLSNFPRNEVIKGLTKVVDDIGTSLINVSNVDNADQRRNYIDGFLTNNLPDSDSALDEFLELRSLPVNAHAEGDHTASPEVGTAENLGQVHTGDSESTSPNSSGKSEESPTADNPTTAQPTPPSSSTGKPNPQQARQKSKYRTTLIPKDARIRIIPPRLNKIYHELKSLNVHEFPNATAILLRVFIELSLDNYINVNNDKFNWTQEQMNNSSLAHKLITIHNHFKSNKIMEDEQLAPVRKAAAEGITLLSASIKTMNAYVHNQNVTPNVMDTLSAWDDLQLFLQKLWTS